MNVRAARRSQISLRVAIGAEGLDSSTREKLESKRKEIAAEVREIEDEDFLTEKISERRAIFVSNQVLVDVFSAFWVTMGQFTRNEQLSKEGYMKFYYAFHLAMIGFHPFSNIEEDLNIQYFRDDQRFAPWTKEAFFDSLLEHLETWTESVDSNKLQSSFVWALFDSIVDDNKNPFCLKKPREIRCITQMTDNEIKMSFVLNKVASLAAVQLSAKLPEQRINEVSLRLAGRRKAQLVDEDDLLLINTMKQGAKGGDVSPDDAGSLASANQTPLGSPNKNANTSTSMSEGQHLSLDVEFPSLRGDLRDAMSLAGGSKGSLADTGSLGAPDTSTLNLHYIGRQPPSFTDSGDFNSPSENALRDLTGLNIELDGRSVLTKLSDEADGYSVNSPNPGQTLSPFNQDRDYSHYSDFLTQPPASLEERRQYRQKTYTSERPKKASIIIDRTARGRGPKELNLVYLEDNRVAIVDNRYVNAKELCDDLIPVKTNSQRLLQRDNIKPKKEYKSDRATTKPSSRMSLLAMPKYGVRKKYGESEIYIEGEGVGMVEGTVAGTRYMRMHNSYTGAAMEHQSAQLEALTTTLTSALQGTQSSTGADRADREYQRTSQSQNHGDNYSVANEPSIAAISMLPENLTYSNSHSQVHGNTQAHAPGEHGSGPYSYSDAPAVRPKSVSRGSLAKAVPERGSGLTISNGLPEADPNRLDRERLSELINSAVILSHGGQPVMPLQSMERANKFLKVPLIRASTGSPKPLSRMGWGNGNKNEMNGYGRTHTHEGLRHLEVQAEVAEIYHAQGDDMFYPTTTGGSPCSPSRPSTPATLHDGDGHKNPSTPKGWVRFASTKRREKEERQQQMLENQQHQDQNQQQKDLQHQQNQQQHPGEVLVLIRESIEGPHSKDTGPAPAGSRHSPVRQPMSTAFLTEASYASENTSTSSPVEMKKPVVPSNVSIQTNTESNIFFNPRKLPLEDMEELSLQHSITEEALIEQYAYDELNIVLEAESRALAGMINQPYILQQLFFEHNDPAPVNVTSMPVRIRPEKGRGINGGNKFGPFASPVKPPFPPSVTGKPPSVKPLPGHSNAISSTSPSAARSQNNTSNNNKMLEISASPVPKYIRSPEQKKKGGVPWLPRGTLEPLPYDRSNDIIGLREMNDTNRYVHVGLLAPQLKSNGAIRLAFENYVNATRLNVSSKSNINLSPTYK